MEADEGMFDCLLKLLLIAILKNVTFSTVANCSWKLLVSTVGKFPTLVFFCNFQRKFGETTREFKRLMFKCLIKVTNEFQLKHKHKKQSSNVKN